MKYEVHYVVPEGSSLFHREDGSIDTNNIRRLLQDLLGPNGSKVLHIDRVEDNYAVIAFDDPNGLVVPGLFKSSRELVIDVARDFGVVLWQDDCYTIRGSNLVITTSPEKYYDQCDFCKPITIRESKTDSWTVIMPV